MYLFTRLVMNVEDNKENIDKNPSIDLKMKVANMVRSYGNAIVERDRIMSEILEQAKTEGISNEQIKSMIMTEMRNAGISDRSIYRVLPDELKNKKIQEAIKTRDKPQPVQEYVPKKIERPTPQEQEYIDSIEPKPSIPVVEERLPPVIEESKEIEPSTTKPVVSPQKREQVIQCPLKVMSRGIAYQVWVTVGISIPEHKVKLDPIDRMDIVKA